MPSEFAGELARAIVWQAVAVPRDPRQIQLEIDAARESLAATLDQLTYRTSPTRLKAKGRAAVAALPADPGRQGDGRRGRPARHLRRRPEDPAPQRLTGDVRRAAPRPGRARARSPSGTTRGRRRPRSPPAASSSSSAAGSLADTDRAVRVCETSHPPVYYVPREDVADGVLERAAGSSWCEWKGAATYWDAVVDGRRVPAVGWSYEDPTPGLRAPARRRRLLSRPGRPGASSTASRCARRPAASTAAGSPTRSSARSRASPAPSAGEPTLRRGGALDGVAGADQRQDDGVEHLVGVGVVDRLAGQQPALHEQRARGLGDHRCRPARDAPRRAARRAPRSPRRTAATRPAARCGTPRARAGWCGIVDSSDSVAAPVGPLIIVDHLVQHLRAGRPRGSRCPAASASARLRSEMVSTTRSCLVRQRR